MPILPRRYVLKLSLYLLVLMLCACAKPEELQKFGGMAQGTSFHISFWQAPENKKDLNTIKQLVEAELTRLDKVVSNYRDDSLIEQFNAINSSEVQALDPEIVALIQEARQISEATSGCYDLTIKPLFDLWGFKGDQLNVPDESTLQATLKLVGFKQLETVDAAHVRKLNPKLRVDLSSIAQGYSVARVAALLEQQGIENYLVEIGGEVQTRGQKPDGSAWRVAIEKPLPNERTLQKVITVNRTGTLAVTTAGTYRHFFDLNGKRYSHILDARTGVPVTHETVSVSVISESAEKSEVWDTALLCLGRTAGIEVANKAGIAALFIEQEGDALKEYSSAPLTAMTDVSLQ